MSLIAVLLLSLAVLCSEAQERLVVFINRLASLRCGDGAQTDCLETKWTFSSHTDVFYRGSRDLPRTYKYSKPPLVLVQSGTVSPGPKANRLNLTESCDLLIQSVTSDDAGVYTCSQISHSSLSNRSEVFLSVVYWSMSWDGREEYTASCSVDPYSSSCGFSMKWLVQGSDDFNLWTDLCRTGIRYFDASPDVLQCEVTDLNSNQVYYFSYFDGKPENPNPNQTLSSINGTRAGNTSGDSAPVTLSWLMLVLRSVEVAVVSAVLLLLLRACASERVRSRGGASEQGAENIRLEQDETSV